MPSDKLSELLVPNMIDRFDAIPSEQPINIQLTKGEVAYLIKAHYQLHSGLSLLVNALGDTVFTTDAGIHAINDAADALQSSQRSLARATTPLIERIVRSQVG